MNWLYHKDENDNIRMWKMEVDGNRIRSVSGIKDGNFVTSTWKECRPKNIGKINSTTGEEQALIEIAAEYRKKQERKYYSSENEIIAKTKYIQPMLAHKYDSKLSFDEAIFTQPKLDGARCVVTKDGMFSRAGKKFISTPHIFNSLKFLFDIEPNLCLDGELYNHDLKDDFNRIMSLIRKSKPSESDIIESSKLVEYHIYDILSNGIFEERNRILHNIAELTKNINHIKYVETTLVNSTDELDAAYVRFLEEGYEGQMIRINGPYENKRSKYLLKRKEFIDSEFEVVEMKEGEGNWSGYYKIVRCRLPDGRMFGAGIKGTQEYTKELMSKPMPVSATIRYQSLTPDGIPRFPIAVNFFWGSRDI